MSNQAKKALKRLVELCLDGDENAWNEVVRIITPVIFSVCRSMSLSREESVDIFGQVCYLLLKNLGQLKSADKLLSYVSTTTRREVLALIRRTRLLKDYQSSELGQFTDNPEYSHEDPAELAERTELLVKAVLSLPEAESRLIWHLFLDEAEPTYEEISETLGRPVSSIGPTRARSLEKLRRILKRMGYKF